MEVSADSDTHALVRRTTNDSKQVVGKSVLLIGPGTYFGVELLERFSKEGFALGIISQSPETALHVRSLLSEKGIGVEYETANILNTQSFCSAVERLAQTLGTITCLIYNPKVSIKKTGLQTTPEELSESIAVNVTGALAAIQSALPFLMNSEGASVIITGGGFNDTPDIQRFALSVGKSGLHGLARAISRPLLLRGIKLKTVVIDGPVRKNGPIDPNELAEFYFSVYKSSRRTVFRYSPKLQRSLF